MANICQPCLQADIILKYDGDEARSLKTYGELPDTVQINAGTEMLEGEEFGDDSACRATLLRACTRHVPSSLQMLTGVALSRRL